MKFIENLRVKVFGNPKDNKVDMFINFNWVEKFTFESLRQMTFLVEEAIAKMIAEKYIKQNYHKIFTKLNKNELANLTAIKIATEIAKTITNDKK